METWASFNRVCAGFGISVQDLRQITGHLRFELDISKLAMEEYVSSLFCIFDTDLNGLVDSLEVICCFSVMSGMSFSEIMFFSLSCFDFDGLGVLSVDEVSLALKTISTGLCKLSRNFPPPDLFIEYLVSALYSSFTEINSERGVCMSIRSLCSSLMSHPDIKTWYSFFNEPVAKAAKIIEPKLSYLLIACDDYVAKDDAQWNLQRSRGYHTSSMKTEPWWLLVKCSCPKKYLNMEFNPSPPDMSLKIDWIHGYAASHTQCLHYISSGSIIYTIGKYVVLLMS